MGKVGTVGWEEGDIAEDRDKDSVAPHLQLSPANLALHSGSSTTEFITSSHHIFFFLSNRCPDGIAQMLHNFFNHLQSVDF